MQTTTYSTASNPLPRIAALLGLAVVLAVPTITRAENARQPLATDVVAVADLDGLRRLWVADPAIHDHVDCGDGLDHRDAVDAPSLTPDSVAAMLATLSRDLRPATMRR